MAKKSSGPNYEAYLREYKKQEDSMKKRGLTMYSERLTKVQYEATYKAKRNDLKKMVANGDRKVIGNVNQALVRKQAYEISEKQAKALSSAAEKMGFEGLSARQIREMRGDTRNFLTHLEKEQKQAQKSGDFSEFTKYFFGS